MERGTVVKSIAGHDKGTLYVVLGCDEKKAQLCDGRLKKLNKPKQKNVRHIRPVGIKADLSRYGVLLDAHIKKELKSVKKEGGCCLG